MITAPATQNNISLAASVNSRIHSDAVMLAAKASMWRSGGISMILVAAGIGIGAVFYGYSFVNDNQTFEKSADKITAAIVAGLEHATVGVKGTVEMTPGTVELTPGGRVSLEPGGKVEMIPGTVTLKSGATIGEMRPTERQFNGDSPTLKSSKTVTNYTVFKTRFFEKGQVSTGWDYSSSEQETPIKQYCYYLENASDNVSTKMDLAIDGKLIPAALGYTINGKAAASQCVWFNGQPTI